MRASISGLIRPFMPAFGPAPWPEVARAAIGAFLALGLVGLILASVVDLRTGLYLIAPFGASAVLIFAVPNSPLAQPWSAIAGNTVAALVGVVACRITNDPAIAVALAVGGAIAAMMLCGAVHPPGGAVAMTAALSPDTIADIGFRFALTPVAAGTAMLVLVGIVYARATGRHYPMRQGAAPTPVARVGLSGGELEEILRNYRQSLNLGTADLARLIGAAQLQVVGHRSGDLTVADIMSRDLVTVAPDTPLDRVADLFRAHGFTSLPVVEGDLFKGVIFQIHLIRRGGDAPSWAREVMETSLPVAAPDTPVAALLPMMADGVCDAVPVLQDGRILGIVTRTDLIAAVARQTLAGG